MTPFRTINRDNDLAFAGRQVHRIAKYAIIRADLSNVEAVSASD